MLESTLHRGCAENIRWFKLINADLSAFPEACRVRCDWKGSTVRRFWREAHNSCLVGQTGILGDLDSNQD
jgi:hypothetical protein